MSTASRRRALAHGRRAERLCLWLLRLKGYRVLAHDLRLPGGEVDIIARRGRVLAIIEVKRRAGVAAALDAVTALQRRRIARAAALFVAGRPALAELQMRFDVIIVASWLRPIHMQDAWRP